MLLIHTLRLLFTYIPFLILCISQYHTHAQYSQYPAHQSQTFQHVAVYNPAVHNQEGRTQFFLNYQRYLGAFEKVNNKLFWANINLNNKDSLRSRHNLALKLNNEEEGDYISRNKAYVSYGFHLNFHEDYWIGTGVYAGLAGYQYKGGTAFTQGSDLAPDGDLGIVLYRPDKFTLAFAANQILNSIVQPKDLAFRWRRFYTLYSQRNFELNAQWTVLLYAQHIFRTDTYHFTDLGAFTSYQDKIIAGTNLTTATKLAVFVGIQNINVKSGSFSFLFNYSFPFVNHRRTNIQALELTLGYKLGQR